MERFAFAVLAAICAFGGYGAAEGVFAPVNSRAFRMQIPGGADFVFVRDADEPDLLIGPSGWTAEIDGERILAMDESSKNGFMFFGGLLRLALEDGVEKKADVRPPGNDEAAIGALWPAQEARLKAAEAPDIWSGGDRLRLWFDNPNKAGLLFAEIALASLFLVFLRGRKLKIAGVALFLASFAGLLFTSSRGAFLALVCGVCAMIATKPGTFLNLRRLLALLAVGAVAAGAIAAFDKDGRFTSKLFTEGSRETSRLTIWKHVPKMMADAPSGWGFGQSARAYIDWYQPESECLLKDLISGHLTFLVESGNIVRFLYVFAWLAFMLTAAMLSFRGHSAIPLGIVTVFFTGACFNPVVGVAELWIVPVAAFAGIVRGAVKEGLKCALIPVIASAVLAIAVLSAAIAYGRGFDSAPAICRKAGITAVNGGKPDIYIVDDDYAMHGGYWWLEGREIRDYFASHQTSASIGFAKNVACLPKNAGKIVLIGQACSDFMAMPEKPEAGKVVFLSPPFSWKSLPSGICERYDAGLVAGALASRLADGGDEPPGWVTLVPGAELYIPDWLDWCFSQTAGQ